MSKSLVLSLFFLAVVAISGVFIAQKCSSAGISKEITRTFSSYFISMKGVREMRLVEFKTGEIFKETVKTELPIVGTIGSATVIYQFPEVTYSYYVNFENAGAWHIEFSEEKSTITITAPVLYSQNPAIDFSAMSEYRENSWFVFGEDQLAADLKASITSEIRNRGTTYLRSNPSITDMARKKLEAFWYGIFTDPNITEKSEAMKRMKINVIFTNETKNIPPLR